MNITKHLNFLNRIETVTFNKTIKTMAQILEDGHLPENTAETPTPAGWEKALTERVKAFTAATAQELEKKINDYLGYLDSTNKSVFAIKFLPYVAETKSYVAFITYEA